MEKDKMDKKDKSGGRDGVSYLSLLAGLGGEVPRRKAKLWERIRDALEAVNADWEFDRAKPMVTWSTVSDAKDWRPRVAREGMGVAGAPPPAGTRQTDQGAGS